MNEIEIESLLFKQVEKPKNLIAIKIVNVYDNRYRINLYCETEEDFLIKKRICASYFCHYSSGNLAILDGNSPKSEKSSFC